MFMLGMGLKKKSNEHKKTYIYYYKQIEMINQMKNGVANEIKCWHVLERIERQFNFSEK